MENRSASPPEGNTHARFDEGMQRQRLYLPFMQAPAAICILRGPNLVFELANHFYSQLVRADGPLEGRPLLEALPTLGPKLHTILQQVYTQGERFVAQEFRVFLDWDYNGQPYEKYLNFVYEPLRNDQGAVDGILGIAYEVTDQVLARRRLALLAEASAALSVILDETKTLQIIAQLTVPTLANCCIIDIIQEDSALKCVAWAQATSEMQVSFDPVGRSVPASALPDHPFGRVLASRTTEIVSQITEAWIDPGATNCYHLQLLRDLACHTAMIVPVIAPERTIGMLTFGLSDQHRTVMAADRELAEELANRVALALAHARLYAAEQRTRIEAEQRLAVLTAVINSIPDAVYVGDTTGITMCNEVALSMLGFTTRAELNQHIAILAELIQTRDVATGDPLPAEQQPFALALGGDPQIRDVLVKHIQSGEERIVRCAAAPIRHQGKILGAVAVNTDITIRKQAEEARLVFERSLLDTQRWESLGVLAGGIAHDFNNLLTGILGNAESVLRDLPANMPFRTELDQIVLTAQRAAELTRQMLAYAGKGQHLLELVSINTMSQEVSMMINAAIPKTTTLTLQLARPLPLIEADRGQLRQVIMNLVMNAVEALPGGLGTVTVQTSYRQLATHEHTSIVLGYERPAGPVVVFSVSDTGSGMDAATQTRIFEPFFTTKFTGRGLGLAAVSGIVRAHKGALMISSSPGHGTTMTIAFPPSTQVAQRPEPDSEQRPTIEQGFTILVVEDEPAVLQLVVQTLTRLGHQVLQAENGQAGINLFQAHAQQIGMVLLDLTMPDLQGNEVAAAIWQIEPQARIVVMSGYGAELVDEAFPEGKLAGFLPKPFTIRELRRAVANLGEQESTRST